jgi:signal transduction histidine kinase
MDEGRREFEFRRTDIYPLLKELVSGIQDRVRHDGFKIQIKMEKPLPILRLDSEAMTQVVTNLIDNAIKYSGERKKIIVRAYTENRDLIISVQDFGVGIRKEELDKVFERFYRVGEELTRRVKGSGLGLTLVKQIVEAHQGTVEVESEPGLGSIFSLRIPIRE